MILSFTLPKHAQMFDAMATSAKPPITYTPLSSYLFIEDAANRKFTLDAAKAKTILDWQPHHSFSKGEVEHVIRVCCNRFVFTLANIYAIPKEFQRHR